MVVQKTKRFGEREVELLFALERRESQVFSSSDAARILGTSRASVKNVLKRLKKKRRIIPLQKGLYLFAPLKSGEEGFWSEDAFRVVPSLVKKDYYVGFVSAMNYWGMTEQMPVVVYVALNRQKQGLEAVQTKFVFVKKKVLGEYAEVSFGGTPVNVSSVEQTILDGLSFPEYCAGIAGVAKAIWFARKKVDWKKLAGLAKNGKSSVRRRLGYLLELLGLEKQARMLEGRFTGYSWLDAPGSKTGFSYSKKWGLKVNEEKARLLEFLEGH